MAVDINDLGTFSSINAVWKAHPEGGHEGDYLTIGSVKYRWNKYLRIWENASTVTPTPARLVTTVGGDFTVNNDTIIGDELKVRGDTYLEGDVKVEGMLDAKAVKQPNRGFFQTEEALKAAYPKPDVGWWATVGDVMPGTVYRCQTEGVWTNTGQTGGVDTERVYFEIEDTCTSISTDKALSANQGKQLKMMIDSLKLSGYMFAGIATPDLVVETPDEKVFYLAPAGTYENFGDSYTVPFGSIGVFTYRSYWRRMSFAVEVIVNEINVSKTFPTGGLEGTDKYDFATAVSVVPASMRKTGTYLTFTNSEGKSETWQRFYDYGNDFASILGWYKLNSMETSRAVELALSGIDNGDATEYGTEILTETGYIDRRGIVMQHNSYAASEMMEIPSAPQVGTNRYVKICSSTLPNGAVSTIAFYDSEQNYISGKPFDSLGNGFNMYGEVGTYKIPSNASYFRVCSTANDYLFSVIFNVSISGITSCLYNDLGTQAKAIKEMQTLSSAYVGLVTRYSTVFDSSILTLGSTYLNPNGIDVSNSAYIASEMIEIPPKPVYMYGDVRLARLKSRVNINAALAPIAFYDSGQNFISSPRTPGKVSALNLSDGNTALYFVPENAAYFRVCDRSITPYDFELAFDIAVNGIIANVIQHEQVLQTVGGIQKPSVWMPKHIYMLRGIKSQIFMAGIACAQNPETLHMAITYGSGMSSSNAKGYNRDRVFEWTPQGSDMNQVYRFGYTHDFFGSVNANNATTLHNVAAKPSPSSNKNILCIGDSFTDQNWWVSELNHLLTGHTDSLTDPNNTHGNDGLTNLTFIGTQDTDKTPNEGYSGKTYQWFCGSESPFYYNGDVNFTSYCNANGFSGIDIAIILLGTNGGNGEQYVKKIWDKLLEHNPSVKVLILGRCFAVPYGTGTAGMQHNQTWIQQSSGVQSLNATFEGYTEEETYNSNFLFVEYNVLLDNVNNMPWSNVNANDRRTDVKVRQATDNVHPSKYGYWQIADAVRGAFHYWCI